MLDGGQYRRRRSVTGAYLAAADGIGDRTRLRARTLTQLKTAGIGSLRVLAMSEASGFARSARPAFVSAPGRYDESLLQGLDLPAGQMGKRDMRRCSTSTISGNGRAACLRYVAAGDRRAAVGSRYPLATGTVSRGILARRHARC